MSSQSFPEIDFNADADSLVDPLAAAGSEDDFSIHVVRAIQTDAVSDDSASQPHFVSLDAGSLFAGGTHGSDGAKNDVTAALSLPADATLPATTNALAVSSLDPYDSQERSVR